MQARRLDLRTKEMTDPKSSSHGRRNYTLSKLGDDIYVIGGLMNYVTNAVEK